MAAAPAVLAILALACVLPVAAQAAAADAPADMPLYLEATLNGGAARKLLPFILRGGALYAHAGDLRSLGFSLAGVPDDRLVALSELPGLAVGYDHRLQRVELNAPLALLSLQPTRIDSGQLVAPPFSPTAPGLLLNYDLYAAHSPDGAQLSTAYEARVFGIGPGVYSQTMTTRLLRSTLGTLGASDGWQARSVRLDTSWQQSWPDSALMLQVGDSVTGNLGWSRAVRIGGIRIGTDFGLQPYRIVTPQPAFFGEVAVPSTVDLYINGVRQSSNPVPVGPFQLIANPGISGTGNAQLVVTDAFGRSSTMSLPFYSTQRLLAAGLTDWSVSFGAVRLNYGQKSFSYDGPPVLNTSYRRGIDNRLTLEAHAEIGSELHNGGLGGQWLLGRGGVVGAAAAYGAAQGQGGALYALGWQWNSLNLFADLNTLRTRGSYRDIASLYGQAPARVTDRAAAGINTPWSGSLGLSYLRQSFAGGDDARYAGLWWSRSFGDRLSASASLTRRLSDGQDLNLFLSLTWSLGGRVSASSAVQRSEGRSHVALDVSSPVPGDGGWGWRTQLRDDDGRRSALAETGWLGRWGRLDLGAANFQGRGWGYANASGSLVWVNGGVFAARDIADGFALVSTDGMAGVAVKLENRVIGSTDEQGLLLVTRLNAWQRNKLSIDPMELPADMRVGAVEQNATPAERAGVIVRFALQPVRAAVLVLHDADGQPLPLGSRVWDATGLGSDGIVGYDGESWSDTLQPEGNHLRVLQPDGRECSVRFDLPAGADGIPRIGPLVCVAEVGP